MLSRFWKAAESSQLAISLLLAVAPLSSFVQRFSNKQDLENSLDSKQPLSWWVYSNVFLTLASPTTEGDQNNCLQLASQQLALRGT